MSRPVVVVDVETTGLDPSRHVALTCAWWNLSTGEHAAFVCPRHDVDIRAADPEALAVNRFHEVIEPRAQDDGQGVARLHDQLVDAVLAGSNPAFDARFLRALLADHAPPPVSPTDTEPWHHRLGALETYAAGRLGIPMGDLPGLATVCERLGIDPPDHTAAGDVRAAGEALIALGAVERPGGGA